MYTFPSGLEQELLWYKYSDVGHCTGAKDIFLFNLNAIILLSGMDTPVYIPFSLWTVISTSSHPLPTLDGIKLSNFY